MTSVAMHTNNNNIGNTCGKSHIFGKKLKALDNEFFVL
jgi:hypothetical protein